AYSAARTARTARIQQQSRQQGQIYHFSGPAAFVRDLALASLGPERLAARYDWLYGFRVPL
ncbi:MAG: monooxygenase, partial [Beijerinckiaceae bacterium]